MPALGLALKPPGVNKLPGTDRKKLILWESPGLWIDYSQSGAFAKCVDNMVIKGERL